MSLQLTDRIKGKPELSRLCETDDGFVALYWRETPGAQQFIIEKLNREEKITIIMVTHDLAAARSYASHILHIGHKTFFGTNAEYFASDLGRHFTALVGGDRNLKN